jgi:hypothetical protein
LDFNLVRFSIIWVNLKRLDCFGFKILTRFYACLGEDLGLLEKPNEGKDGGGEDEEINHAYFVADDVEHVPVWSVDTGDEGGGAGGGATSSSIGLPP